MPALGGGLLGSGNVPVAGENDSRGGGGNTPVAPEILSGIETRDATRQILGPNPVQTAFIDVDPISGNGITDATSALNNWVASVSPNAGARIKLPFGNILVNGNVPVLNMPGITIEGKGAGGTAVVCKTGFNTDIFTLTNGYAGKILNMRITAQTQRSGGFAIKVVGGDSNYPLAAAYPLDANETIVDGVDMDNQFGGWTCENDVGPPLHTPWKTVVRNARWMCKGGFGVDLNATTPPGTAKFGASHVFENMFVYSNPVEASTGAAYRVRGCGDARFTRCDSFGTFRGLIMDPAAQAWLTTVRFHDCFFDSAHASCAMLSPDAAVTTFGDIAFEECWFASSLAEHGLYLATAKASNVRATSCVFINSNIFGLVIAAGCENVNVINPIFSSNRVGGFIATGSATHFGIIGGEGLGDYGVGSPIAQPLGGQIDLGCDFYRVTDMDNTQCATQLTDNGVTAHKLVNNLP